MEKISTKVRRPYVHYIQKVTIYQAFFCDSLEKKKEIYRNIDQDFLFILIQSSLFLSIGERHFMSVIKQDFVRLQILNIVQYCHNANLINFLRISTNFRPKQKKNILNHLPRQDRMGRQTISRYCPFNNICIFTQNYTILLFCPRTTSSNYLSSISL